MKPLSVQSAKLDLYEGWYLIKVKCVVVNHQSNSLFILDLHRFEDLSSLQHDIISITDSALLITVFYTLRHLPQLWGQSPVTGCLETTSHLNTTLMWKFKWLATTAFHSGDALLHTCVLSLPAQTGRLIYPWFSVTNQRLYTLTRRRSFIPIIGEKWRNDFRLLWKVANQSSIVRDDDDEGIANYCTCEYKNIKYCTSAATGPNGLKLLLIVTRNLS